MVSIKFLERWMRKNIFILVLTVGVIVNIQIVVKMLDSDCKRKTEALSFISENTTKNKADLLQKLGTRLLKDNRKFQYFKQDVYQPTCLVFFLKEGIFSLTHTVSQIPRKYLFCHRFLSLLSNGPHTNKG